MKAISLSGFLGSTGHTCSEEQIEIQWKEQGMLIESGNAVGVIMEAVRVVAVVCELFDHLKGGHEERETQLEDPKEK